MHTKVHCPGGPRNARNLTRREIVPHGVSYCREMVSEEFSLWPAGLSEAGARAFFGIRYRCGRPAVASVAFLNEKKPYH
jgi:hypothetical protein